jgi:CheY-like chemotaxis protein
MHHLVLADDSVTIQKVVELTFAEEDFEVHSFSDGASALEYLKDKPVDVLLADIFLPFVDGYDLCRAVRQNERTPNIPVILLAGTFEPFDSLRAERAGCTSHITKPFETGYLVQHVTELIARAEKLAVQEPEVAEPRAEEEIPGQVFTFAVPASSNGEAVEFVLKPEDCVSSFSLLRRDAFVGPRIRHKRREAMAAPVAPAEPALEQEGQDEVADSAAPFDETPAMEPMMEAGAPQHPDVPHVEESSASGPEVRELPEVEAAPEFAEEPAQMSYPEVQELAEFPTGETVDETPLNTAEAVAEPLIEADAPQAEEPSAEQFEIPAAETLEEIRTTLDEAFVSEAVAEAQAETAAQAPAAQAPAAVGGLTEEQVELITQRILSRLPEELRRWLPEIAGEAMRPPGKQDE